MQKQLVIRLAAGVPKRQRESLNVRALLRAPRRLRTETGGGGGTLTAAVRSIWYSSLESVCDGATTIDSPVWMPIGSKFSMLHTVTQLS